MHTMTNKLTNKTAVEKAMTFIPETEVELLDKLAKVAEGFAKKSNGERKPSKAQMANDEIRQKILALLNSDPDKGFRVSEICAGVPDLEGASSQRVSGLMRTLFLNGQIDKYVDKRVTYYKVMPQE